MNQRLRGEDAQWRDIEDALRRSQTLATAGQFAASIVHEINNPLEAIANLAFLIKGNAHDADSVRGYVELMDEQLANLARIAHRTLSFYRPAGILEAVDVVQLAEAALRVHEPKIYAKKIRVLKSLHADATVKVHAGEILQVVSNLVANALDALPDNGTLCVRVRKHKHEVHVIVADDGHGIPKTMLDKVFEPFFTTKAERGTGLGLAISKDIVERHNGRIKTRSSIRKGRSGTAFRVTLPLDKDEDHALAS